MQEPLVWTKNKPAETGHYWHRRKGRALQIFRVIETARGLAAMAAYESQISKMTKRVIAYRQRYHRFAHDLRPAQDGLKSPCGPV